jgi:hypothetical protein
MHEIHNYDRTPSSVNTELCNSRWNVQRYVLFQVSAAQSDYAAHKGDGFDPSDPGLRPSLLEEVLAQKKLVCNQTSYFWLGCTTCIQLIIW